MKENLENIEIKGLDQFYTPKQIATRGLLSLVTQWKERNKGRLKFYQIGTKILYSDRQISEFLALCERSKVSLSSKSIA